MTDVVKYRIPAVTVDGPTLPIGTGVFLEVHATVEDDPGGALALHVRDWSGPVHEGAVDPVLATAQAERDEARARLARIAALGDEYDEWDAVEKYYAARRIAKGEEAGDAD